MLVWKFVILPWPPEKLTSLPTSVATKTDADAVKFIATPDVDAGVNVVDVVFWSKYGPFVKSTSVKDQDVWPVLLNFLVAWLLCVIYITSALCANLISNSSAVK